MKFPKLKVLIDEYSKFEDGKIFSTLDFSGESPLMPTAIL